MSVSTESLRELFERKVEELQYPSITMLARDLGVTRATVYRWWWADFVPPHRWPSVCAVLELTAKERRRLRDLFVRAASVRMSEQPPIPKDET